MVPANEPCANTSSLMARFLVVTNSFCSVFGIVIVFIFHVIADTTYLSNTQLSAGWSQAVNDCPCSSALIAPRDAVYIRFRLSFVRYVRHFSWGCFQSSFPLKPSPLLDYLPTHSNFTLQIICVANRSSTSCLSTSPSWTQSWLADFKIL